MHNNDYSLLMRTSSVFQVCPLMLFVEFVEDKYMYVHKVNE